MTENNKIIWNKIRQNLQYDEAIDPGIFNNYLKNAHIYNFVDNKCFIIVENAFAKEILTKNLKGKIQNIIEEIIFKKTIVCFIEEDELKTKNNNVDKIDVNHQENEKKKLLFDSFVTGESNNEAYQAALTVTIELGKYWNPLFIYGTSGLGKTHLLKSIESEIIKKYKKKKKVLFISSEEFGRMIPEILRQNNSSIENFKNSFNEYDVLLVDDIQFLANRVKTNEFFFHIFNNFIGKQKQIVLTSDRSPEELYGFEERNISRFQSGLNVTLDSPNKETALAIIDKKIRTLKFNPDIFTQESLEFIANNFSSDVRKLEGSLNRLLFYSVVNKKDGLITIEDVLKTFKTSGNLNIEKLTSKKIKKVVSEYYNIPLKSLNSSSRVKKIANVRHISMYLIKELLNESFVNIGLEFGGKNHTTVISACKKVKKNIEKKYDFKKTIDLIKKECLKA